MRSFVFGLMGTVVNTMLGIVVVIEVLVVAAASVAPTPSEVAAIVGPKAWPALQHGIDLGLLEVDSGRVRFTHPLLAAAALDAAQPKEVWEVRGQVVLVQFSPEMRQLSTELKTFLFDSLYRHTQVVSTMDMAKQVVRELFAAYVAAPKEMHSGSTTRALQKILEQEAATNSFRMVADHVAGMTDRFAASEHYRLTGVRLLV